MSERTPPGTRGAYRAFGSITTRWADNDVYGHVNNVVYYAFFDTAVNRHLIEAGALDPERGTVIGLVVETGCRYHAPLSFPDEVTAGIRVGHAGRSSVSYELGLFPGADDVATAEGHLVHVYVDRATRRPVPLPDALRTVVDRLLAPA